MGHPENELIGGFIEMKKISSLLQNRMVWATGAALLAIVAAPAIVGLVLKALGWVHGASLHTWLLDVGQNMGSGGAAGSFGAGAAAGGQPGGKGSGNGGKGSGSGGKGSGSGGKGSGSGGKGSGSGSGPSRPGSPTSPTTPTYTPTVGNPTDPQSALSDPAFRQAQQQYMNQNPVTQTPAQPTGGPINIVSTAYHALENYLTQGQLGGSDFTGGDQ
jgi:hypothetical protein